MQKKLFIVILLIIVLNSVSLMSFGTDSEELNKQKNEIQNKLDEANKNLENIDAQLSENLQQIGKIDQSIVTSEQNLKEINSKIEESTENINKVSDNLQVVQKEYDEKEKKLKERLITKYESGKTTYLDVLLSSKTLMQFISNCYLVSEITEYDNELLNSIEQEKEKIEEQKKELQKIQNDLEEKRNVQIKTETILANSKTMRETYVAKLNVEEQKVQADIDECYRQIALIEQEIRGLASVESLGPDYIGGAMVWPIPGYYTITSSFGMRVHPITGVYKLHTGTDVGAPIGSDFIACAYGIVVKAEYNTAYGNMVVIDHGGGVQTLYAHGSEIIAQVGQVVNAGDVILKVGNTGYSTGPHAHFEVRINGEPQEPLQYIKNQTSDENSEEN